jgi:broad specificity phosphatase PhoE
MRLLLVRHGDSHHAYRQVIAGPAGCTGLTARGVQQTHALAARLRATGEVRGCVSLRCSPWLRARQTAELLAVALPGVPIEEDPGLCELVPGEADGLSWETYRTRYGAFPLPAEPDRPFSPGGESWTAFTGRVETTLLDLARRFAGQTVVAVTHAGFIVVACLVLFGLSDHQPGRRARLDPAHTALTEWWVEGGAWRLVRYNDAAHLREGA